MSAGNFVRSRYQADYDEDAIHPIRVQPETLALALQATPATNNAAPTGAISNPIGAMSSLGNRERGLRPRMVTLQLPSTSTPPAGFSEGSVVRLPVLNRTLFAGLSVGTVVVYLGVNWEVIARDPEQTR